jgi:putative aminopeptidase FrvX
MCSLSGKGVACIDMAFPCRYTHSALEVCDLADLAALTDLLLAALGRIDSNFSLDRDDYFE